MTRIEAINVNMITDVSRDLIQAENHLQRGRYDDAIRVCRRYVDPETRTEEPGTSPIDVGFACYLLGQVVIKKGRESAADRAIQFYDRSIELSPTAHAHSLRAAALHFRYKTLWREYQQQDSPEKMDMILDVLERSETDFLQAGKLIQREDPTNNDFIRNITERLERVWTEIRYWKNRTGRLEPSITIS